MRIPPSGAVRAPYLFTIYICLMTNGRRCEVEGITTRKGAAKGLCGSDRASSSPPKPPVRAPQLVCESSVDRPTHASHLSNLRKAAESPLSITVTGVRRGAGRHSTMADNKVYPKEGEEEPAAAGEGGDVPEVCARLHRRHAVSHPSHARHYALRAARVLRHRRVGVSKTRRSS